MIEINWTAASVVIAVFFALLGLAAGWGMLRERVRNLDKDHSEKIENNKNTIECVRTENRQDHKAIFDKLDEIKKEVRNSNGQNRQKDT